MPFEFFFSYTRSDNDVYLQRLFDDISFWVRRLTGANNDTPVGFFDQRNIELGADWDATIVNALQTSKILVSVGSPAYFRSEYCGKEWALFRQRCNATPGGTPPLLKSIVWVPFAIAPLPAEVRAAQLLHGVPEDEINKKGLIYLKKNKRDQADYKEFVYTLATEIVEAGRNHVIAPLPVVPRLADMPSAFHLPPPEAGEPVDPIHVKRPPLDGSDAATAAPTGPKHVHFVFVAANPVAFGAARKADAYYEYGAGDWKPFFPEDLRPIHPLLQQVASSNDMMFSSAEVQFGDGLLDLIEEACNRRQMVVIVVDPWSLHWDSLQPNPSYQQLLAALDKQLDFHWSVIVPWNEQDPDWISARDQIMSTVRTTFNRHASLLPMFYREGITSAQQLQATVAESLTRLKEEITKRAPVLRPIPPGLNRPVVTGPSASRGAS